MRSVRLDDMRRFSSTELFMLGLAAVFLVMGVILIVHPTELVMSHPGVWAPGVPVPASSSEVITRRGARIYGFIYVALAFGLGALIVFPKRN